MSPLRPIDMARVRWGISAIAEPFTVRDATLAIGEENVDGPRNMVGMLLNELVKQGELAKTRTGKAGPRVASCFFTRTAAFRAAEEPRTEIRAAAVNELQTLCLGWGKRREEERHHAQAD